MGKVYFGNKNKQTWIKSPLSGMKASSVGWQSETQLLSGRTSVKRSSASHRRFDASWLGSLNTSDTELNLNTIKSFADGLYGDGPFYWIDPFATDQNLMPEHWAAPMLAEKDWPQLSYDLTPTFSSSSANNQFPIKYATYTTTGAYASTEKLVLIIPTGYKLMFGWHGPTGGSTTGIRIAPYLRSTGAADTAVNPTMITAGGTVRTNTSISGTTYSYVEIFLATTGAATVNITGMIAQIIPTSSTVASGGFIPGKGTTGLQFSSAPTMDYYSSAINDGQVGMSATWVEV
jgi:hypothetical protein